MDPREDIADVTSLSQKTGWLTKCRSGHNVNLSQTMDISGD